MRAEIFPEHKMETVVAPEEPEKFKPSRRLITAFISIAIVNLATALDATIISVVLPVSLPSTIDNKLPHFTLPTNVPPKGFFTVTLKGDAIQAFWAGTSFLPTSMVQQPNFITFSHLWGRRPLLLFAIPLFTIGAIVCATAKTFTAMLAGRSIQGSGSVVFQNRMEANLAAYPSLAGNATQYSLHVGSLIRTIDSLPSQAPETIILKDALSHSIRTICTVFVACRALLRLRVCF